MHYLSANFSYLGPGFALVLTLVGAVFGLFGWRIVRMVVVLDAVAVGAFIAIGLQAPSVRATLPVSPMWAGGFVLLVLPVVAIRFPHRSAVGLFGVIGFLGAILILLDIPMDMQLRLGLATLSGGIAMALGLTVYHATTVFITGIHGGCMVAVAMAIIAAYPSNFVGGLVSSSASSFEYLLPAASIAFSTILIAVQWADMQASAAENVFVEEEDE